MIITNEEANDPISPISEPEETTQDQEVELTALEFAASQHPLSAEEQERLEQLHQKRTELLADAARRMKPQVDDTVETGDDSP